MRLIRSPARLYRVRPLSNRASAIAALCRGSILIAGFITVAVAAPTSARASEPVSIYVVPRLVEQPAGTPARVAIHGAFFRLTSATNMTYGAPQCGVMYFQCAPGDETMCRMQWGELATAAKVSSPTTCSGFGSLHVISAATLRQEGAPLVTPDAWDLGMGIGLGEYVDGKCALARALVCPLSGGDGGAPDGATVNPGSGGGAGGGSTGSTGGAGVAGAGGASGTGGAVGTGGAATIPGSGGATAASGGAAPPVDAGASGGAAGQPGSGGKGAAASPPARRSGCSVAGAAVDGPLGAAVAAVMVLGAMASRRRGLRRRR